MSKARPRWLVAAFAACLVLVAGTTPAYADPPGFNGTVKIHEGATESEPVMANDPHVCTFHVHGFNFDSMSGGTWRIVEWPPTGNGSTVAASGSWTANSGGEWRVPQSGAMGLANGHYKLFVDQTQPAAPGGQKHKVFWVDCPGGGAGAGGGAGGQVVGGQQQPPGQAQLGAEQGQPGQQLQAQAPQVVAGVQNLPSTSTERPARPLHAILALLLAATLVYGAYRLVRTN